MKTGRIVILIVLLGTLLTSLPAQTELPKTPQEWVKLRTQFIEENPGNEIWYAERGRAHAGSGNLDEAIKDFTRAIELNPNYGGAYYDRALIILKQGKKTEAIEELMISATIDRDERNQDYPPEAYKKIVELDPKDFRGHRGLGYITLFSQGQWPSYDEAIAHFTTALKLKPKDVDSLKWRATTYIRTEKFALAAADLTQAILLKPSFELYTLRAEANDKLGKTAVAAADTRKAETLSPEPAMKRAAEARTANNLEIAINEYSKAIDLGSTKAYRERGKLYIRQHRYDLALADLKQARVWHYDDFEVELGRGEIYSRLDDFPKALSAYSRVALKAEDKTAILFALDKRADMLLELEKPQLAIKELRRRWQILCDLGNRSAAEIERKRLQQMGLKENLTCLN